MKAASALSTRFGLEAAVSEASAAAIGMLDGGGRVELALLCLTSAYGSAFSGVELAKLEAGLLEQTGARRILVSQAEGLLAPEGEFLSTPAVTLTLLCEAELSLLALDFVAGREAGVAAEVEAGLGSFGEGDFLLLLGDANALDAASLASGFEACRAGLVLGLGLEGAGGAPPLLRIDGEAVREGLVALRLPGLRASALAASARLSATHEVTRVRGNWLLSLDDAPAWPVCLDAAGGLMDGDASRVRRHLVLAMPGATNGEPDLGLACSIVGVDAAEGAVAVPRALSVGDRVGIGVRDAIAAREVLNDAASAVASKSGLPDAKAQLGFVGSCKTRGVALFGEAGLEAGYLCRAFEGAAWTGWVSSYQLVAGRQAAGPARVLGQAGVIARLA